MRYLSIVVLLFTTIVCITANDTRLDIPKASGDINKSKSNIKRSKPNIIIFLADDLGIGDVGYFGNDTIRTPHVDSICRDGVKLSHDLAAASLCTPSRTALMTGRYPVRSGMTNVIFSLMSDAGLPRSEWTLPQMLKEQGYRTALIGKWHLGWNRNIGDRYYNPTRYGFDYFFGMPYSLVKDMGPYSEEILLLVFPNQGWDILKQFLVGIFVTMLTWKHFGRRAGLVLLSLSIVIPGYYVLTIKTYGIWNAVLERNDEIVELPVNLSRMTQRLVNEGVNFLQESKETGEPFFLMMSWLQVHTILHASDAIKDRSVHGLYGDEVEEMDWGIGQILQALGHLDLQDDTLLYFSSDHGGHKEEVNHIGQPAGGWNGKFRGSKGQGGQEGAIRIPTCISWPGHLRAGTEVTEPTSQMDVLVTLADILGAQVPGDRHIDGVSILPLLGGQEVSPPHEFLFHYTGDKLHAVRYRPQTGNAVYKLHYHWPNWVPGSDGCAGGGCFGPNSFRELANPQLYNVGDDPREEHQLDTKHPLYASIVKVMEEARSQHEASLKGAIPTQVEYRLFKELSNPLRFTFCNFPWTLTCKDDANTLKHRLEI